MIYFFVFLGFFLGLSLLASAVFFGRPISATLTASKSSSVYIASCEKGFIPARRSRFFIVSRGSFNSAAISEIVIPCISPIIDSIQQFLEIVHKKGHLLNICEVELEKKLKNVPEKGNLLLIKCPFWETI